MSKFNERFYNYFTSCAGGYVVVRVNNHLDLVSIMDSLNVIPQNRDSWIEDLDSSGEIAIIVGDNLKANKCTMNYAESMDKDSTVFVGIDKLRDLYNKWRGIDVKANKFEIVASSVKSDPVNSPSHYAVFDDIEAIEIIARSMTQEMFKGYCFGNLLKYRLRAGKKDGPEQDISKANKYDVIFNKFKHLCHS